MNLTVDTERLAYDLRRLARHGDQVNEAFEDAEVTRVVFSPEDVAARQFLIQRMRDADLEVTVDAIGNTFGRWVGTEESDSGRRKGAVATGSHIDAIPHAGMYDGTVGVMGGLEAIRVLQASGFRPRRSIEVVMITSEEPTRFGIGCLGSRAMSANLSVAELRSLQDGDGAGLEAARAQAGMTGSLDDVAVSSDRFAAWVELHIEQGPVLEAKGIDIGTVTAIAAPSTYRVTVLGEGGHAGGVLMPSRRDALAAACELILEIESAAVSCDSDDMVATVGTLRVHPGAVNSIPAKVDFSIDARDVDPVSRDSVIAQVRESAKEIAERRRVQIEIETLNSDPPATCDPTVVSAINLAADQSGYTRTSMVSRAYHDSLFMSLVAPMGMIFIPCRGGVSHRPDEYSSPEQISKGVAVLARTLAELAS
ncbi:MAG: M20 family metallo-hydrolase [Planctomycetota bacterium]